MPVEMITFWHWWALGGALLLVELLGTAFFFLWLGAAAGLVGLTLLGWPAMPSPLQFLLFALLSLSSVLAWWRFRVTLPSAADPGQLERRAALRVGRRANLLEPIRNGRGRVRLGDGSWTVAGPDLPAGALVEITGADGLLLQVRPI